MQYVIENLPILISTTIVVIVLLCSTLLEVYRANKLRETLLQILQISKTQPFPVQLYKTIFHQLYLPMKYTENLTRDDCLKTIEKLEKQELLGRWQISPMRLILRSYYFVRLAFAKLYNHLKRLSTKMERYLR
jgi:hypothetical protein